MVKVKKKTDTQSMEVILEKSKKLPKIGDIVEGRVIRTKPNEVILDIPGLGAGQILGPELWDKAEKKLKKGDKVQACLIDLENEQGYMELSLKEALEAKAWKDLRELLNSGEIIEAKILEANRGGLLTEICGVEGFLPVSQLSTKYYPRVEDGDKSRILEKLKTYVGKKFKVKVIDLNQQEEKLIVSEKEVRKALDEKEIKSFKIGQRVSGKVSGIVEFGIFVKFGKNLEGLVHISEIAHELINDPGQYAEVSQKVESEIIGIDKDRISLSMKKLIPDPWVKAAAKYKVGKIVEGEVNKVSLYGAFIKLDKNIQGLAHISELTKDKRDKDIKDILKVGDKRKFKIISIEPDEHRLGLTLE